MPHDQNPGAGEGRSHLPEERDGFSPDTISRNDAEGATALDEDVPRKPVSVDDLNAGTGIDTFSRGDAEGAVVLDEIARDEGEADTD